MRKYVTSFAAVTAIASGVAVLQLKMMVQNKTDDVQVLVQKIYKDQEALRVLEAEWAYRSAPHKLQENSIQFLALMPPVARQIISSPSVIPFRQGGEVEGGEGVLLPVGREEAPTSEARQLKKKPVQKRALQSISMPAAAEGEGL